MTEAKEEKRLAQIGREMSERRQELAQLVQDLHIDQERLNEVRARYSEVGAALREMAAEVDEKRRRAFALKMELQGQQRVRTTLQRGDRKLPGADAPHGGTQRANLRLPYNLHVNFGGLHGFFSGFAVNISRGGMLVAACEAPALHTRFALEFDLDTDHTIRCPVEALWSKAASDLDESGARVYEIGLRFLEMLPTDRDTIARFAQDYIDQWLEQSS